MTQVELCNYILEDHQRIVGAITTGSAWEIWMQVELILILRAKNIYGAREVPYPSPHSGMRLDAILRDQNENYAIEMKVESANNSGAFTAGIQYDITKIQNYHADPQDPPITFRWVIGIGYSFHAKSSMAYYAQNLANNAVYRDGGDTGIGVLIVTVPVVG